MRLPLAMLLLAAGSCLCRAESPLAHIKVAAPPYCSEISGNTKIEIVAPGFSTVEAKCWKQGEGQGADTSLGTIMLNSDGKGSFDFPADEFPHGPITIRISGKNPLGADNCYLQLYNKGGVSWNEGLPGEPLAAKGMKLVFSDDFDGPLSISSTDPKARYYDHKPPNGSQDFSTIPFRGFDEPNNPFAQVGTYLRIRADANKNSAGLISSLKNDGTGFTVKAPCYFECRFIAPNAIGTWPAFWLMTDYMAEHIKGLPDPPVDELDIIEAYGGEGPKSPNSFDLYRVTPHAWNQGEEGKALEKKAEEDLKNPISMRKFGVPSAWYEAPHTYGCKITDEETIYYLDNIEVGRHATLPESKKRPFFFLINLATGGGWPTDLSRYNGLADMYVDWVRVYSGE